MAYSTSKSYTIITQLQLTSKSCEVYLTNVNLFALVLKTFRNILQLFSDYVSKDCYFLKYFTNEE